MNNPQVLTLEEARHKLARLSKHQDEHQQQIVRATTKVAECERKYRIALAVRILELHNTEEVAWSLCETVAKGETPIADSRYMRDVAKGELEATKSAGFQLAADRRGLEEVIRWSAQIDIRALSATGGDEPPPPPPSKEVRQVFDTWVYATGRSDRTQLDSNRENLIRKALSTYPVKDVLDAVRGWRRSPHHRGENSDHKKYNDLSLLLRNSENIEKFRDLERGSAAVVASSPADTMRKKYES